MTENVDDTKKTINWENFKTWIHCICVVTFDLELGQAIETVFPNDAVLTKQEISNICYLAFPDSNSGCIGDTNFIIRLQCSPGNRKLRREHTIYNTNCSSVLQINPAYFWGYVYFRQVKDSTLPRGYFQKSLVIISRLPFNNLFLQISSIIAPEYFQNGDLSLETVCHSIEKWPSPIPGIPISLPLLGSVFQMKIPMNAQSASNRPGGYSINENLENHIQASVEDLNMFTVLQPVLSHIHLLWELILTAEPLVVMAPSPTLCSSMVLALTRIIAPLKYCGDYRPYFTIHDSEFKQFTNKSPIPPPVILGVTNPFFAKTLHHWPHSIRLDETDQTQSHKLKKNANMKLLDNNPGVYTTYKTFLQKDKSIIKKLVNGVTWKRPSEVQSALLKRHLLELTHSFIIPLERYIASLMPLQKNISPFKAPPSPLPFKPDDFFQSLEATGPKLTTGIKGDWVGLYKKFFKCQNFDGWFNTRYSELYSKLQILHLEAISEADLKQWVQGRPEVEVVDMVLKIRNRIDACNQKNLHISDRVNEQLNQRLHDIISSLPDDMKNILKVS